MNVDKNSYTFSFAIIMVIVVAGLLSFTAINLKKPQLKNIELEKKQNILSSIGINVERDKAGLNFDKYIKEKIVLNSSGEEVKGDAFKIDLSKELKKIKRSIIAAVCSKC